MRQLIIARKDLQMALDSDNIDGVVIDPWTSSATLDCSLLNGLLHASHDTDEPGEAELRAGSRKPGCQNKLPFFDPHHFSSYNSRCFNPAGYTKSHKDAYLIRSQYHHDQDHIQKRRNRCHNIRDPHQNIICGFSRIPGCRSI